MNFFYEHMFYIPIFKIQCINWENKKNRLNNLCGTLELANDNNNIKSDYHSTQTVHDVNEKIAFVTDVFRDELTLVQEKLNFDIFIDYCWFEETERGGFHPPHTHGNIGYSAVCYVNYNNSFHTSTTFLAPFSNFTNGEALEYNADVKEGDLIIFPSSTMHYTRPNNSDHKRTIISFNLKRKK